MPSRPCSPRCCPLPGADGPEGVPPPDLILPVPLHANRQRWRGYNQSTLLAEALGVRLEVPVAADALARVRDTRAQVGLSARARRQNVSGAFVVRAPHRVSGRTILLVDDVVTTGATLAACAEALYQADAEAVWAVTLACAQPAQPAA
ncbi:MAG: phosphoribosyltransferase family protein [Anaerolineae bacterium]|nr:phosphoribosyltransferase family protein [Anaerolineae bacterium]